LPGKTPQRQVNSFGKAGYDESPMAQKENSKNGKCLAPGTLKKKIYQ
jgi:hypothetical protein